MHEIDENGIRIYPLPDCDSDEDEDYKEQVKQLKVSNIVKFSEFLIFCGAAVLLFKIYQNSL